MMKILLISDTHTDWEKSMENTLKGIIKKTKPDLILSAGDWGVIPFSIDELKKNDFKIKSVIGNHDNKYVLQAYGVVGNDIEIFDNTILCFLHGLPVSDTFSSEGSVVSVEEYLKKALQIRKELKKRLLHCDILVTHAPITHPAVKAAVELIQPKLHLSGHVHDSPVSIVPIDYGHSTGISLKLITLLGGWAVLTTHSWKLKVVVEGI